MKNYHIQKLNEVLELKQKNNPSYSMRAFARFLEIDSSNLSAILKGKRGLPPHRADEVACKISLTAFEKKKFINSTYQKKYKLNDIKKKHSSFEVLNEDLHYDLIAKWEYFAVFELLKTKVDNVLDIKWVSNRLSISKDRALSVVSTLDELGFISIKENTFNLNFKNLDTTFDISSLALKEAHKESLEIGINKLNEIDISKRDFSSLSLALNKEQIPVIKSLIREFQDKIYSFLDSENKQAQEVYMLNTQFFPLTEEERSKK